ncbi:hypothetical protein HY605_05630 [Candidatus Peregrinibacteria bacterium]|nr:hypothetical protein [Candidatus Peregrinibacteria bacterium]
MTNHQKTFKILSLTILVVFVTALFSTNAVQARPNLIKIVKPNVLAKIFPAAPSWKRAQPVILNTLDVSLNNAIQSANTLAGAVDVPSLAINLRAGNRDLYVQKIKLSGYFDVNGDGIFGSTPGSETYQGRTYFLKDVLDAIKLYDQNDRLVGSPDVLSADGQVTFQNLNFFIPKDNTKVLKAKVDVNQNSTQDGLNKKFSFDIVSESDIVAQSSWGLIRTVKVNDNDGNYRDTFEGPNKNKTVVITIVAQTQPGLNIQISGDSFYRNTTAAAGQVNILHNGYRFRLEGEDLRIRKLTLKAVYQQTGSGGGSGSSAIENPIEKVTIKFPTKLDQPQNLDGAATSYGAGDYYDFSALNFMLAETGSGALASLVTYIDIKEEAKDSFVRLNFIGDAGSNFEAVGLDSGNIYGEPYVQDVASASKTIIYQSKPYYVTVTNGQGGCPVNSFTFGENVPVYCFAVTADQSGAIDLYKITIGYRTTGIATGESGMSGTSGLQSDTNTGGSGMEYKLYDVFNQGGVPYDITTRQGNSLIFTLDLPLRIYGGQTKYFIVKGKVIADDDPQTDPTIRSSLIEDAVDLGRGYPANQLSPYQQVWSDLAAQNHNLNTSDWYNGYALETLPTQYLYLNGA